MHARAIVAFACTRHVRAKLELSSLLLLLLHFLFASLVLDAQPRVKLLNTVVSEKHAYCINALFKARECENFARKLSD